MTLEHRNVSIHLHALAKDNKRDFSLCCLKTFKRTFTATQLGQKCDSSSEASSSSIYYVSKQQRFWQDCADAQARLSLGFAGCLCDKYSFHIIIEPPHDKINKMADASSDDSDQPGHLPSLIGVFAVHMKTPWVLNYLLSVQRRQIRLGGCPGWSESLLDAYAILLVLSWGGSL